MRWRFSVGVIIAAMFATANLQAQDKYYYHSVNTNTLAASFGKTYKVQYQHQLSHRRQFVFSATYILDKYDLGPDRVESDVYALSIRLQRNLIYLKRAFINVNLGVGGYYTEAINKLDIEVNEVNFNIVTGIQLEVFLVRERLALLVELDGLFMPFSDIYDALRVPTAGLEINF